MKVQKKYKINHVFMLEKSLKKKYAFGQIGLRGNARKMLVVCLRWRVWETQPQQLARALASRQSGLPCTYVRGCWQSAFRTLIVPTLADAVNLQILPRPLGPIKGLPCTYGGRGWKSTIVYLRWRAPLSSNKSTIKSTKQSTRKVRIKYGTSTTKVRNKYE